MEFFSQKEPYCNQYLNSSTYEPYYNQYLNSSTSEKFLHFRQEKRVKLLFFFFNFVILDYPYKNMLLPITSYQQRSRRFLFFLYAKDLALVAGSMVSANHWLKGMETYTFLWQLTLVSVNQASGNSGQLANVRFLSGGLSKILGFCHCKPK